MTIGLPAWIRREAFNYVESLAGPLLAWEYLRRNPAYRNAWILHDPADTETARRDWGLLLFIDPDLDARAANPIWCPDPPSTCASSPQPVPRTGSNSIGSTSTDWRPTQSETKPAPTSPRW